MRWSPLDVEVGATLGGIQEPGVLGKLKGRSETIDRPRLSSCPIRIVAPSFGYKLWLVAPTFVLMRPREAR